MYNYSQRHLCGEFKYMYNIRWKVHHLGKGTAYNKEKRTFLKQEHSSSRRLRSGHVQLSLSDLLYLCPSCVFFLSAFKLGLQFLCFLGQSDYFQFCLPYPAFQLSCWYVDFVKEPDLRMSSPLYRIPSLILCTSPCHRKLATDFLHLKILILV